MQELIDAIGKWSLSEEVCVRFRSASDVEFVLFGVRDGGATSWYFGEQGRRPLQFASGQIDFALRQAKISRNEAMTQLEEVAASILAEWSLAQAQARASFSRNVRRRSKEVASRALGVATEPFVQVPRSLLMS
jgi:hypothetical protein